MTTDSATYAARLEIDYPGELDRLTTLLRIIWFIPIGIIFTLVAHAGETLVVDEAGHVIERTRHLANGLVVATALMIVFRQRYPRWWFDFQRELTRFGGRVFAYLALMTDRYPSTVEEQSVHLEIDYPDVERDLNRWLPVFKWFLAIPHVVALAFLLVGALVSVIVAWLAILVTGRYPRGLFDYVVGVFRWGLRVNAYALLLVTDEYPPFSLR
jgi:hypothetical protein